MLDPSVPAELAVQIVISKVEDSVNSTDKQEQAEIMKEAQAICGQIKGKMTTKQAVDRQAKMHNLYIRYKIRAIREDFMIVMATCNYAAMVVVGDALDKVRELPEYNARFSQMRRAFLKAEEERHAYDRGIRYSDNHWLDVSNFTKEEQKRYAPDLSPDDYLDYWQCIGGKSYKKMENEINVLRNKFRLSVEAHGYPNAEEAAYVLAGASMLMLCDAVYTKYVKHVAHICCIKATEAHEQLKDFSLQRMMLAWSKCVRGMGKITLLDAHESRNVELTLEQLIDHWNDDHFFRDSVLETAEEFPEIFRTKGEQKKYLREYAEKHS